MEKNYVLEARKTVMEENLHEIRLMKDELAGMREQAAQDIVQEQQRGGLEQAASSLLDNIKEIASLKEAHSLGSLTARIGNSSDHLYKDRSLGHGGYER